MEEVPTVTEVGGKRDRKSADKANHQSYKNAAFVLVYIWCPSKP